MKTFNTIKKATDFVSLFIEGTFGEGFTLKDFTSYDIKFINELGKSAKKFGNAANVYVVIRETGTQIRESIIEAEKIAKEYYNSKSIIEFTIYPNGMVIIDNKKIN